MFQEIIDLLIEKKLTISTMESCTGGAIANQITNTEGASEVFSFGAVTYSNEYKIKMGVDSEVIDAYTVYSMETAQEMSKAIATFTGSDYGIGVTGKLNQMDPSNPYGADNIVYISLYDSNHQKYQNKKLKVSKETRVANKKEILIEIKDMLLTELKKAF